MTVEPTDVFGRDTSGRCAVLFLAQMVNVSEKNGRPRAWADVADVLAALVEDSWALSTRAMAGADFATQPVAYATGGSSDVDIVGMFEAPSISAALAGICALEAAGWARLMDTEWLLGPREFWPVGTSDSAADWGLIALWEWNDAWCAASIDERRRYDAECDVAFHADLANGIAISGRHRMDWVGRWHHLAVWEAPSPEVINAAMNAHEHVADFRFTLSRHYLGKRGLLQNILAVQV